MVTRWQAPGIADCVLLHNPIEPEAASWVIGARLKEAIPMKLNLAITLAAATGILSLAMLASAGSFEVPSPDQVTERADCALLLDVPGVRSHLGKGSSFCIQRSGG